MEAKVKPDYEKIADFLWGGQAEVIMSWDKAFLLGLKLYDAGCRLLTDQKDVREKLDQILNQAEWDGGRIILDNDEEIKSELQTLIKVQVEEAKNREMEKR